MLRESTFETQYGTIHYWVSETIDNQRNTLLLLPGLTADHRLFDQQVAAFAEDTNLFVWDAPGHGLSRPFQLDFDLKDKATWLYEIIQKENLQNPVLVGQSMGGYVGQMFLQLFPEKLKGFVSIDSAPLKKKYMTNLEIRLLKNVEPMYRYYPWKALLRDGAKGVAETAYGQQLMMKMMMDYEPKEYARLAGHGYGMLAKAVEQELSYEITCPALLICGEKDRAGIAKNYNKRWHKETGIPIEWIENAGHNSNTDDPKKINSTIKNFLENLQ